LASRKEIHSTEKLLNLIRTKTDGDVKAHSEPMAAETSGPFIGSVSRYKKVTIGVDIGHTYIKMAKVVRLSDTGYALIDYLTITPDWLFTINNAKFLALLKSSLKQFCNGHPRYEIWSAIPSAMVETRCLRIPKLPQKQVANAVYWTFTKTVDFNEANELLDFEILGDITEQGVKKTEVLTYKFPKKEMADLKSAFAGIGYPLKGISIAPFAVQNLFRTGIIPLEDQNICSLFIGREWSRIAVFSRGNLVLSRGIKAGMQSMVDSIEQALSDVDAWPAMDATEKTPSQKSSSAPDARSAKQLFDKFIKSPRQTDDSGSPSTALHPTTVFQMLQPAVERLIRQVERTFEHFTHTFHREGISKLFLSGQICANPIVVQYIGHQLDLPIEVLNPFGPGTGFAQNVKVPDSQEEKESYGPAIGLALADNALTPNTLYTHREKDRDSAVRRLNMRILTGCIVCLIILIGIFMWQEGKLDDQRQQVERLNQQLSVYRPPVEKNLILSLFGKVQSKRTVLDQTAKRYQSIAVVSELSQITPVNIRLLSIEMALHSIADQKSGDKPATVVIEGLVFGNPDSFEATLTGYLLELKNSLIFDKPNIQSRQIAYYDQQQVLRFKVGIDII